MKTDRKTAKNSLQGISEGGRVWQGGLSAIEKDSVKSCQSLIATLEESRARVATCCNTLPRMLRHFPLLEAGCFDNNNNNKLYLRG